MDVRTGKTQVYDGTVTVVLGETITVNKYGKLIVIGG